MIMVFIDFELIYYFKISLQIMPANKMMCSMCSNNSELLDSCKIFLIEKNCEKKRDF